MNADRNEAQSVDLPFARLQEFPPTRPSFLTLLLERACLGLFLLGLVLVCVFATWAETPPYWYGASSIALAACGFLFIPTRARTREVSELCAVSLVLFAAYTLIRAGTSQVAYLARQDIYFCIGALLAWLLVATRFTGRAQRMAICGVLALLIFAGTGIGLYQYFKDPTFSIYWWADMHRAPERSAGGFYESGNHFAGFLELAALPLLSLSLGSRLHAGWRIFFGSAYFAAATGVLLSTSRGGVLSFALGSSFVLCGLAWRHLRRSTAGLTPGVNIAAISAVLLLLFTAAGLVLQRSGGTEWSNLNSRQWLWPLATEQWMRAPWLGTGARSFEYMERSLRTMDSAWLTWSDIDVDAVFAHSDILQCLADYGAIGLGLAILAGGAAFRNGLKVAFAPDTADPELFSGALALGSTGALTAISTHSIFDFNLHIGANTLVFGAVLGMLALQRTAKDTGTATSRNSITSGCSTLLAGACAALLLIGAVNFAPGDWHYRAGRHAALNAQGLDDCIRAIGSLEKAARLDPENPQTPFLAAVSNMQIAETIGQPAFYKKALSHLEQSLSLYPQNPYAAAKAGRILDFYQRYGEAEEYFRRALIWGSGVRWVHEAYADHLRYQDLCFEALQYYSLVDLRTPESSKGPVHAKMKLCRERMAEQKLADPEASQPVN